MTHEAIGPPERLDSSEISSAIERYKQSNPYSALSKNSQEAYRRDLAKLDSFCQSGSISNFLQLAKGYEAYLTYLRSSNNKDSTVTRRISVTRAFLRWSVDEKIASPEIEEHFPLPKFSKSRREIIGQDKEGELIARIRMGKSQRDAALILLMLKTGAEPSEILKLKFSDVIVHDNQVRIQLERKAGRQVVTLDDQTKETMLRYMEERKAHQQEEIFVHDEKSNKPLRRQSVWLLVKKYGWEVGLPDLNSQILHNTWRVRHKSRP